MVGIFVQKYEKIFFDFYGEKIFFRENLGYRKPTTACLLRFLPDKFQYCIRTIYKSGGAKCSFSSVPSQR